MKTFFSIIFIAMVIFDFFMVTPLGAYWTMKNLDEGKPCYGMIFLFATIIPMMIIGCALGFIK